MNYLKAPGPSELKSDIIEAIAQDIYCEDELDIDQNEDKKILHTTSKQLITT